MALNPVDRDTLREHLNMVTVVGAYVRLQHVGGEEWRGLCPFHEERTPSFYVNAEKRLWICRGQCGTGGDIFDFVMRAERLEFRAAAELLANQIGMTLASGPGQARRSEERERLYQICGQAADLFERALQRPEPGRLAREYLAKRGLNQATIDHFKLGYAPEGFSHLTRRLERAGIDLRDAEAAGLVKARRGGGFYDTFRCRLMFPIIDSQGRTLGFGGRVLRADDEPKYLNTRETPIFAKGSVLYGLPDAVGQMNDGVVIVEGYMDVIGLHQHGIHNAVATLGTALTSGHLRLLRRHTERIILCYDADNAGRRASERAAALFINEGLDGRVLSLPNGLDPDEFVGQHGQEAFLELVRNAPDLMSHRIGAALEQAGGDALARADAVREAAVPVLARVIDPLRRTALTQEVVRICSTEAVGLSGEFERSLVAAVRDYAAEAQRVERPEGGREAERRPRRPERRREVVLERDLLADLLAHAELRARAWREVEEGLFSDPRSRALFVALRQAGEAGLADLSQSLDDSGRALLADLACRPTSDLEEAQRRFGRRLDEMRANLLQSEAEAMRARRLELAPDDDAAQMEWLAQLVALERELDRARQRLLGE